MRVSFANIILLSVVIFFFCDRSQASLPVDSNKYNSSVHAQLSCLECHSDIVKDSNHPSVEEISRSLDFFDNEQCIGCHGQVPGNSGSDEHEDLKKIKKAASDPCISCHTRHHEKVAHDAHIDIPCVSCHMENVKPLRVMEGNRQIWAYEVDKKGEYDPHRMISEKDEICLRCHFKDNNLGASDHAPPAKSIICMPCHAATLSAGDVPSIAALIIFVTGISCIMVTWMSAVRRDRKRNKVSFSDLINSLRDLILDGLFQKRLLKISLKRWAIHAMIFFPFIFRFLFGIAALVLSLCRPDWELTWSILDKNSPVTGFLYDLSGLFILAGGCFMIMEKRSNRILRGIQALPKDNLFIYFLLGGIIISGFVLEGARISMTGSPEGSEIAFIGYGISRFLRQFDLGGIYIYLWYLHAIITGAFVACLPFSRMFHVFVAPLSLILKAASGK